VAPDHAAGLSVQWIDQHDETVTARTVGARTVVARTVVVAP
jgi:hypothetical protein